MAFDDNLGIKCIQAVVEPKTTTAFERDQRFIESYPTLAFFRLLFEPGYVARLAFHIPEERGRNFCRKTRAVGLGLEAVKIAGYGLALYVAYNSFFS